jgi:hypothetical protein
MPERGAVVQCGRHTIEVRPAIPLRVLISNRFTVESVETLARVHGLVLLDRQISQAGDEGVFLAALAAPGQGRGKKILRDLAC